MAKTISKRVVGLQTDRPTDRLANMFVRNTFADSEFSQRRELTKSG